MNKLRKTRNSISNAASPGDVRRQPEQQSRSPSKTLSRALDLRSSSQSRLPSTPVQLDKEPPLYSSAEQYWAARALTAETVLSVSIAHQRDLRNMAFSEEAKRSRELAALTRANEAKQARMEKLVLALLAALCCFVLVMVYLISRANHIASLSRSGWFASHFTIPILSPFSSVVEHEMSVVGTKTIFLSTMVLAVLAFAMFRHWNLTARLAARG